MIAYRTTLKGAPRASPRPRSPFGHFSFSTVLTGGSEKLRTAYKILAHIISAAVVVQAATIGMTTFLMIQAIGAGTTMSEDDAPVTAMLHGMLGQTIIPILVLALIVVALFAHAGLKWALWLAAAVAVQVTIGILAFDAPWLGLLHAANAFTVLALAEVGAYAVAHASAYVPHAKASMRPAM